MYTRDDIVLLCRDQVELVCAYCGQTIPPGSEHYALYIAEIIGVAFLDTEQIQCCDCAESPDSALTTIN